MPDSATDAASGCASAIGTAFRDVLNHQLLGRVAPYPLDPPAGHSATGQTPSATFVVPDYAKPKRAPSVTSYRFMTPTYSATPSPRIQPTPKRAPEPAVSAISATAAAPAGGADLAIAAIAAVPIASEQHFAMDRDDELEQVSAATDPGGAWDNYKTVTVNRWDRLLSLTPVAEGGAVLGPVGTDIPGSLLAPWSSPVPDAGFEWLSRQDGRRQRRLVAAALGGLWHSSWTSSWQAGHCLFEH